MLLNERKLLRINLSNGDIKLSKISEKLIKQYLGGRGLASKYLVDEVDPKIDPLSPKNKIIFAGGLLTGSNAPTGGRYMVVCKGPLTGTIASSNSGGTFGAELAKAGIQICIIEGKAKKPVYISIKDNEVKIEDAGDLWGLNTHETTDKVLEAFGQKNAKVACIGPAGEKLSLIAAIINEKHRAAARTGVGAVMGSKNLKAITVKGSNKIEYPKQESHKKVRKALMEIIKENPITGEGLPALGTKVLDSIVNEKGLYPANNFQYSTFDEAINEVNGEALVLKGYLKKKTACWACPIACGRDTELPNGRKGEGPEYETGWAFGADCGVDDLAAITEANYTCNELGLDTISAGATIACAMELYEKGYIPKADLQNGPELKFGRSECVTYYTKKMGLCEEGIGAKMAEGSYRFAESYGRPQYSMSVKKQELPAYDPRGVQGHALAYATSNRGGCHVRGYLIALEVLGVPEKLHQQDTIGKAMWCKVYQDLTAMIDSAGLCIFTIFALGVEDYKDLINNATGMAFTAAELADAGERIWNLERKFNIEAGVGPEQDALPERFTREPVLTGHQRGATVKLDVLLADYYKARGWTKEGYPKGWKPGKKKAR
ncbi:MAG: aldehyde ferredoxin oxidoreductase family protein [Proteobacteria bacterium]|nr:aldehyde ferredoxin oxidoreductase family protein [Pseudomonadota bacterium]